LKFTLPAIYPITDSQISGLTHSEQVNRLISGGAEFIQLREKRAPAGEWFTDAQVAVRAAHARRVRIIINDRADLAMALGADGIHLGQDDLPPAEARKLLGDDAIIGFSTHTLEQVQSAIGLPINYIAFGPIFRTRTKGDADETVGLGLLEQVSRLKGDLPLIAIGGINGDNVADVFAAGADSAAMIGYLLSDPISIEPRIRQLLDSHR